MRSKKKSPPTLDFHKLSLQELCDRLGTSPNQGLTNVKAKALLTLNGKNQLKKPSTHICQKIIKYCFSGFCWLLWIGSIVLFLSWKPLGDPPDATNLGLAILLIFVVAFQAVFEAFQDWTSGKVNI